MVDWCVWGPWHCALVVVVVVCISVIASWTSLLEFMLVVLCCMCEMRQEIVKLGVKVHC
jgi:hypothetical protein